MFQVNHDQLYWLLLLPLLATALTFIVTLVRGRRSAAAVAVFGPLSLIVTTIWLAADFRLIVTVKRRFVQELGSWVGLISTNAPIDLLFDPLTAVGLVAVAIATGIVALSAAGNDTDAAQPVLLNLLLFAAATFLCAGNILLLLSAWILLGVIGYLLTAGSAETALSSDRTLAITGVVIDMLLFLVAVILIRVGGTSQLGDISGGLMEHAGKIPRQASLAMCGLLSLSIAVRMGLLPFGIWRLRAAALSPAGNIAVGAVAIVTGIYFIGRMAHVFAIGTRILHIIAMAGALSATYFAIAALLTKRLDRFVAAAFLAQAGIVVAAAGKGAFVAATEHAALMAVAVAAFGACFMVLVRVLRDAGMPLSDAIDVTAMGGLGNRTPRLFLVSGFALVGLVGLIPASTVFTLQRLLWQTSASSLRQAAVSALLLLAVVILVLAAVQIFVRIFYGAFQGPPEIQSRLQPLAWHRIAGPALGVATTWSAGWLTGGAAVLGVPVVLDSVLQTATFRHTKVVAADQVALFGAWLGPGGFFVVLLVMTIAAAVASWLFHLLDLERPLAKLPGVASLVAIVRRDFFVSELVDVLIFKPVFGLALVVVALIEALSGMVLGWVGYPGRQLLQKRSTSTATADEVES